MDENTVIEIVYATENIRDLIRLHGNIDELLKQDIFNSLDKIDELANKEVKSI